MEENQLNDTRNDAENDTRNDAGNDTRNDAGNEAGNDGGNDAGSNAGNLNVLSIALSISTLISNAGGIISKDSIFKGVCIAITVIFLIVACFPRCICKTTKGLGKLNKWIYGICCVFSIFTVFYILTGGAFLESCGQTTTSPVLTITPTIIETPKLETEIKDPSGKIAAGDDFSMLLRSDKTVVTYGAATGIDTSGWENITQIAAYQDHAIGLREDKTVVVAGANMVEYDVRDWSGIVQVAACMEGVLGLTENGIVRFAGPEKDCRIECKNWTNIQRIIGAAGIIVAQQMDGRLVAVTCQEDKGYISTHSNSRIVSATAVCDRMLYVFENGRVEDMKGSSGIEKVATTWVDMKQVAVGSGFAIGLKQDGSVTPEQAPEGVSFDVSKWENVVAICAGKSHALGLCADGSVVTEGDLQGKLRKIVDVNYWVEY